jgi:Transposase IS116/IS110/IS902 family
LRDLRDRALIATLTYSFARITAALKMKVEDLRPRGPGWTMRLHEKGSKEHVMPCHHALPETLAVPQRAPAEGLVLDQVRSDRLCRRLMTVPRVGPVVALTFRATVDQPQRFARSKAVGAPLSVWRNRP